MISDLTCIGVFFAIAWVFMGITVIAFSSAVLGEHMNQSARMADAIDFLLIMCGVGILSSLGIGLYVQANDPKGTIGFILVHTTAISIVGLHGCWAVSCETARLDPYTWQAYDQ